MLIDEDGCGYVDGELIITAAQNASKNDVEAALNACGAQVSNIETLISDSDDGYTYLSVDYSSGQDPQELCELLSGNSAVAEASVDHVYTLADEADESGEGEDGEGGEDTETASSLIEHYTANDPYIFTQWGLTSAAAQEAWWYDQTANKVTVVTIDSGVDIDNKDLVNNLILDYGYNACTGEVGSNAVDDVKGHGTRVASIIASQANNSRAVAGISYNANVLPVCVTTGTSSNIKEENIIKALNYVRILKQRADVPSYIENIRVVNMSIGGYKNSSAYRAAVENLQSTGVLVVAAAGNDKGAYPYCYPASFSGVVGVSGLKESSASEYGEFDSSYSNYGNFVDIAAAGTKIYSCDMNGTISSSTGTSLAAPFVSGAAALVFACNSNLTCDDVYDILTETAYDAGAAGWDSYYGYGILRLNSAVALAMADDVVCKVNTLAGSTRYGTAQQIVQAELECGSYEGVIVASGEAFADALSATGLAGLLDYPVVLTAADSLPAETAAALNELKTANGDEGLDVVVVGGTSAISAEVADELVAYDDDGTIQRIAGQTRFETNVAVYEYGAEEGTWNTEVALVASANNFPDALAIAPYACAKGAPLVLVGGSSEQLQQACQILEGADSAVTCGGTAAVSVAEQLSIMAAVKGNATRLSGSTRYGTALEVVKWELEQGMTLDNCGFATGANFPDALASGFLLGKTNNVLFLLDPTGVYNQGAAEVVDASASSIEALTFFGGDGAVTPVARAAVLALFNRSAVEAKAAAQ